MAQPSFLLALPASMEAVSGAGGTGASRARNAGLSRSVQRRRAGMTAAEKRADTRRRAQRAARAAEREAAARRAQRNANRRAARARRG